jgi:hypothetical protein
MIYALIVLCLIQFGILWKLDTLARAIQAQSQVYVEPKLKIPKREPKESREFKELKTVMDNLEAYDGTGRNQRTL